MADIFDEVREDLRAERAQQLLRRYGVLLVIAAVLIVVGAAGWQGWQWRKREQANDIAATFLDGMRKSAPQPAGAAATPSVNEALGEFDKIAATGPEGYRTLARLRAAALKASGGDLPGALTVWDQISADTQADPLLRDVANLMWVQHQVDRGEPAAIEGRLAPMIGEGNPWRPLALEQQALLSLRTGQDGRARDIFKRIAADPAAPEGVRARAGGLLSRLGEAPIAPGVGG